MKRALVLGFVGVLMVCAPGCSGGPDGAYKDMISAMNGMADSIEKKESPDKIKASAQKVKVAFDKLEALKLSKEEKDKLEKKYEAEGKASSERMDKALKSNPEAIEHVMAVMLEIAMKKKD